MLTQPTHLAPQHSRAAALLDRFRTVRAATMHFCSPLTPEDMMVQSCAEASPVKWHLAHTTWFFETFVLPEFVAAYQALRSRLPLALQQRRPLPRRDAREKAPCLLLASAPRRNPRLPPTRRCRHRPPPHQHPIRTRPQRRILSRPRARAAAPRASRHRHQARLLRPTRSTPPTAPPPISTPSSTPGQLRDLPTNPAPSPAPPSTGSASPPARPCVRRHHRDRHHPRPQPTSPPSPSTTRPPATPSSSRPSQLATRPSPAPSTSPSSKTTATPAPSSGSPRAGTTLRAEAWHAPLYWSPATPPRPSGWPSTPSTASAPSDELSETPVCHLSFFEADAFARCHPATVSPPSSSGSTPLPRGP